MRHQKLNIAVAFSVAVIASIAQTALAGPVGDPVCDIGVFRNFGPSNEFHKFYLDTNRDGSTDISYQFGDATDVVIVGDWDADFIDDVGAIRAVGPPPQQRKYFLNTDNDGAAEQSYQFGAMTEPYILGDWDGNGSTNVGLIRDIGGHAKYFLDHGNGQVAEESFEFGLITDTPVVGDWDGPAVNGSEEHVGFVREEAGDLRWYLDTNDDGVAEIIFTFGEAGDTPIVGDWNGDGFSDAGVLRVVNVDQWKWFLDTGTRGGTAKAYQYGNTSDTTLICNWVDGANQRDDAAVARPDGNALTFLLDWVRGGSPEEEIRFGQQATDTPIVGDWDGL